jgi:hypothetical protein
MSERVSEQNIPKSEQKSSLYWKAYASLDYLSIEELGQLEYEVQRELKHRGENI